MRTTIAVFAVLVLAPLTWAQTESASEPEAAKMESENAMLHPQVVMKTTLGDITLELDAEKAPITVQNFLRYGREGYYTGTIFHRVISTFMIQGGGFTADVEKKTEGLHDPIVSEWPNKLRNKRGTIAMARTNDPDSATSQFFINVVDNHKLDQANPRGGNKGYCVFGQVVDGMETVDKIRDTPVAKHPNYPMGEVTPVEPVVIEGFEVKGDADAIVAAVDEAVAQAKAAKAREAAERAAQQQEKVEALIAAHEQETGKKYTKTDSGMYMMMLEEGEGDSPKATDKVAVHYTGTLLNGKKFDSSADRGQPAKFRVDGVIKGWTEALLTMRPGGKAKLIIPPDLAYGEQGRPPRIPSNSWLAFDVELIKIVPGPEEQLAEFITKKESELGKKFEKTDSGLMSIVLTPGKGGDTPKPTDNVMVHYTGTLLDGTKFDSSVDRGQPATFPLNRVIPGWTEGVGLMTPGEKRLFVIPPDLAYGMRGSPPKIAPNSWLVFEVELLEIK